MVFLAQILVFIVVVTSATSTNFDDTQASIQQIIEQNGFKYQEFAVTSSDGYIGKLHRIPSDVPGAKPVLLMHG